MQRINVASPDFTYEDTDPPGFKVGMLRFGKQLGAVRSGTSVYEIPLGQTICPYHYEYGEEEWLLVLDGRPTLRHHAATTCSNPGTSSSSRRARRAATPCATTPTPRCACSCIPPCTPAVVVYPDSDKMGIFTGNREDDRFLMTTRSSAVDYWLGETDE